MIDETEEARESRATRRRAAAAPAGPALPPPVRRIVVDSPPTVAAPTVRRPRPRRARRARRAGPERMTLDELSVFYGAKAAVKDVSLADPPGRGARADRALRAAARRRCCARSTASPS